MCAGHRVCTPDGRDDLGVSVECNGRRVTVAVPCRADAEALYGIGQGYEDDGYGLDEEDEEYEEEESDGAAFESEDGLLNLLTQVRQQLIDGDYRAL